MKLFSPLLAAFSLLTAGLVGLNAEAPAVALQLVADGLTQPLAYAALPGGRALLVDQSGGVFLRAADGGLSLALSLSNRLSTVNYGSFDERGVLCLVLHPKFSANRRLFITYTAPVRPGAPADFDCTLRLSEFRAAPGEPLRIDPASEIVRLEIDKPYHNHNGGRIAFGPDGRLYMSVGDGGNANDEGKRPEAGNAQNLGALLGKILRLDVETPDGHGSPSDNPFVHEPGARPEIWAYGLRNPWAMTFDRGGNHELFVADVGQNLFEEVDIIVKGGNYGWRLREGFHPFDPKAAFAVPAAGADRGLRGDSFVDPVFEYTHPKGPRKDPVALGISITGGYIYRGKALPSLAGRYVFGDWSRNFGLPQGVLAVATRPDAGSGRWTYEPLEVASPQKWTAFVCAFGEDDDGELYVFTNTSNGLIPGHGRVWKIVPAP